jgi:hypothetical protein
MKTIKAAETIIITGLFRKRYWYISPGVGIVLELEVKSVRKQKKEYRNAQTK